MGKERSAAERLAVAEEAARRAGRVLMERFPRERKLAHKGAIDLVTDADTAAERAILETLAHHFPDHAVLAEESGVHGESRYRWIVDPLDGTTNYAHSVPQFAVSIACEADGRVDVGVIYDPVRDELYSAILGGGARRNGEAISVSQVAELREALLCTGFPYWIHEHFEQPIALFSAFLRRAQAVRRFGAAAIDLAWIACGRFDGFFELGLEPWDVAAGSLIIREAGGVVTNLDGTPFSMEAGQILAAPPTLHAQLLEVAREVGPVRLPHRSA
ncbi:MAG: inositol monophosphatase family protein [Pseudomonadota bacterium]|nr:MAG: inositol monophosphatase [Pseudomonadota bacterium]